MDNSQLVQEIRRLSRKVDGLEKKVDEMRPYIETLHDIKSTGKVISYVIGGVVMLTTAYLAIKQVIIPSKILSVLR